MNLELFTAFLLISFVLVISPGPVVTLVIATGATQGTRPALITVAGSTLGNALLIGAIAFGLNVVIHYTAEIFEVLRWVGRPIWCGSAFKPGAMRARPQPQWRCRVITYIFGAA